MNQFSFSLAVIGNFCEHMNKNDLKRITIFLLYIISVTRGGAVAQ